MSKIWANSIVITIAAALSLEIIVRSLLRIPVIGSLPLFISGVAIYLFFATAIGLFWPRSRARCRSSVSFIF